MMLAATSLAALFAAATAEVVPNVGYVNGWAISEMAVRDDDRVRLSSRIRLSIRSAHVAMNAARTLAEPCADRVCR